MDKNGIGGRERKCKNKQYCSCDLKNAKWKPEWWYLMRSFLNWCLVEYLINGEVTYLNFGNCMSFAKDELHGFRIFCPLQFTIPVNHPYFTSWFWNFTIHDPYKKTTPTLAIWMSIREDSKINFLHHRLIWDKFIKHPYFFPWFWNFMFSVINDPCKPLLLLQSGGT